MATQPTLAMIPSGYKDGSPKGKLYSVLPTDGVGDFDVTRGSNATRINKNGLIETVTGNTPRLDYPLIDGVVSGCPTLLLEPARTNLINYSENFQNYFNVSEVILDSDYAISPDGTLNANRVTYPSSSASMYKSGLSLVGIHTFSFWVKGEGSDIGKTFDVRLSGTSVNQNLDVTITEEWVRFEAQTDGLGTLEITNRSSTTIGTGSILLFGFQLEQGSYATSYIPTSGSTQTRAADTANGAGNASTFNDSEGVLFTEVKSIANTGVSGSIFLYDASNISDRVAIILRGNGFITSSWSKSGETSILVDSSVLNYESLNKVCLKYSSTNFNFFVNGFEVYSINGNYSFSNNSLDNLSFSLNGAEPIYGNTKQLQYYNTALTDLELETLTSYTSFNAMALAQNYTI